MANKINKTSGISIAKLGYKEEVYINDLINNKENEFRDKLQKFFNIFEDTNSIVLKGNTKSDLKWGDQNLQIKKSKQSQFGQLSRSWIHTLCENIPELSKVKKMLIAMCELPLKEINGKQMCDKKQKIVKLSKTTYTERQLNTVINLFEANKENILRYSFLGYDSKFQPNLFCTTFYKNKKRHQIIVWKTQDIINYLMTQKVKIRTSETVIEIGSCFTFQRKGGDCGKPGANQFQFKLYLLDYQLIRRIFTIVHRLEITSLITLTTMLFPK